MLATALLTVALAQAEVKSDCGACSLELSPPPLVRAEKVPIAPGGLRLDRDEGPEPAAPPPAVSSRDKSFLGMLNEREVLVSGVGLLLLDASVAVSMVVTSAELGSRGAGPMALAVGTHLLLSPFWTAALTRFASPEPFWQRFGKAAAGAWLGAVAGAAIVMGAYVVAVPFAIVLQSDAWLVGIYAAIAFARYVVMPAFASFWAQREDRPGVLR